MPDGFLNIDKPAGMTSRDVVNRVQRWVRPAKCGHAGTLDPLATGVLVVCVGKATRLMEFVQRGVKGYRGVFRLGVQSDTEDVEGDVRPLPNPPIPTRDQIERVLPRFFGEIDQVPPVYSAKKVGGRRAYDLARKGEPVDLKPARVTVHSIALVEYDYPSLTLEIVCGAGTYIRSLGRDIAKSLGTAAVMSELVRTRVGPFALKEAVNLDRLQEEGVQPHLHPLAAAVGDLPRITVSEGEARRLAQGQPISQAPAHAAAIPGGVPSLVAALSGKKELIALVELRDGQWRASKVLVTMG